MTTAPEAQASSKSTRTFTCNITTTQLAGHITGAFFTHLQTLQRLGMDINDHEVRENCKMEVWDFFFKVNEALNSPAASAPSAQP